MRPIPLPLLQGPFTPATAREHGVGEKMLRGQRFTRVLPGVWRASEHAMTRADEITAAQLALPERARLSHRTRIEHLGYDARARGTLHFTIAGDLHLDLPGIMLHRTAVLPPCDDVGVHPAAAFIQACAEETLIEAVRLGDYLLTGGHMDPLAVTETVAAQPWRPGTRQALSILPLLDGRVRSPRESDTRMWLVAAGLPRPQCNVAVFEGGRRLGEVDLWLPQWRHAIEVEGHQHFDEARQVERDVHRYGGFRAHDISYTQVTGAMSTAPVAVVMQIDTALRSRGYDGPAPVFGDHWQDLWRPIRSRGLRWAGDSASTQTHQTDAHSPPPPPPPLSGDWAGSAG